MSSHLRQVRENRKDGGKQDELCPIMSGPAGVNGAVAWVPCAGSEVRGMGEG